MLDSSQDFDLVEGQSSDRMPFPASGAFSGGGKLGKFADCSASIPLKKSKPMQESERVVVQLCADNQSTPTNFKRSGYDKIIVPFSVLDLEYTIHGNVIHQRLMPGEGIFIPSENKELFILSATCEEYLMIELCISLRDSIRAHIETLPASMLKRATIIDGAQNLLNFAHTARRLLMSPLKNSDAAIQALGVIAVSEAFICVQTCSQRSANLSKKMIEKIDNHIREHLHENLCLTDLAELCELSMHHFARSFKVVTGKTPYQYILDRRIGLARRRLCETSQSIAEIAYEAGFSSQSHMTDLFRRFLGTTPGKYREAHK